MVEEMPFYKRKQGFKSHKELPKIMVLIAFNSHCPYHKHLEVIKVKVNKLWSICLTKYKLAISYPLSTRAAPHATQLQSPVSSCHSKYMCIIENRQRGTPCPMIRTNLHIKMTRQADNEHLSNLLIYHGNMVLFSLFPLFIISFFVFSLFLNLYLFFYKKNASQMLVMVTLQVFTMTAWIRLAAQAFL